MSEEPSSNPWDKVFKANKPAATPTPSSTPTPQPAPQPTAPITPKAPENPKANTTPFSITPNATPQSTPTASQPVNTEAPKAPILSEPEFEFKEAESSSLSNIVIYGEKADGKTTAAMSFPGSIAVLSFDKKSVAVKENVYRNDPRIKVYDAIRFLDEQSPSHYLDSSEQTFKYVLFLLDEIKKSKPDWVVIDGLEMATLLCELTMRSRNNLQPFQGVQFTLWRERNMYLWQIHKLAMESAKRGVIYTTYIKQIETMRDGQTIDKVDKPSWADSVLREADVVIRTRAVKDKNGIKFFAEIESSKLPSLFITGTRADITDIGLRALNSRL